jgi:PAS domain S-box-containing protein
MLVIAVMLPWIGNVMYLFDLTPWPGFDLTPIAFTLSAVFVLLDLFRYQFLDLLPVARDVVIDSMSDLVIVLDSQWRVVDLNSAARASIDRTPDEVIGKPVEEAFPNQLHLVQQYRDVTEAYAEVSLGEGDNIRHFDLRLSPLQDWRSQMIGTLVVLRDISEHKTAERALRESNERLSILRRIDAELTSQLDVNFVLFSAMDAAIRISYADAGFIGLVEGNRLRVVQASGGYLQFVDTYFPTDQGILGRVIRQQQPELIPDVNADPDYQPVLLSTRAMMTLPLIGQGRFIGLVSLETRRPDYFTEENFEFIKLLTGRIAAALTNARAYQKQEQLVQELDAFAHTVAHDLKNPLNVMQGYAQILIEHHQELNPEMQLHWLRSIVRSTHKMFNIIDALLMLAGVRKMETVPTETLDMNAIVTDVRERLELMIKELEADMIMPEKWPSATGYTPWVAEVLTNYVSNALKYGGRPPRVELGATPDDGCVRFWVRDNGQGLSAEQQAQLFTPFTRLAEEDDIEGHGLGLSIVQRIVERLGGEVGVESEKGKGSTFSFSLPADGSPAEPQKNLLSDS